MINVQSRFNQTNNSQKDSFLDYCPNKAFICSKLERESLYANNLRTVKWKTSLDESIRRIKKG